jgi:hypothetical protein
MTLHQIYRRNTFLRNLNEKRGRARRGFSSQSPSKFLSRDFLKYLRDNRYISRTGIEYAPCEVDNLYFQKCTEISTREADQQCKEFYSTMGGTNEKRKAALLNKIKKQCDEKEFWEQLM